MAAAAGKMVGVSEDSSSSSEDETLKRCREAVWETRVDKDKDGDSLVKQSKRVVVAEHEHDGNELQVTQGFRTHVAKKLGLILDSYITETKNASSLKLVECDDDDDGGFRLFSSSVPGQTAADPPAPAKRRPVPSSSDSDSEMEMRLREAAVSVKDLIPSSPQAPRLSPPPAELPTSDVKKKKEPEEEEEGKAVKKKKKKKKKRQITQEETESSGSQIDEKSNGMVHGGSEQENTQVKVKQKKKKKRDTEALD